MFVAGVENDPEAARLARQVLDDVVEGNIEEMDLPYGENSFDCILFADVLEHLIDPLAVLKKIRKYLKPQGTVVASIPNVQFMDRRPIGAEIEAVPEPLPNHYQTTTKPLPKHYRWNRGVNRH